MRDRAAIAHAAALAALATALAAATLAAAISTTALAAAPITAAALATAALATAIATAALATAPVAAPLSTTALSATALAATGAAAPVSAAALATTSLAPASLTAATFASTLSTTDASTAGPRVLRATRQAAAHLPPPRRRPPSQPRHDAWPARAASGGARHDAPRRRPLCHRPTGDTHRRRQPGAVPLARPERPAAHRGGIPQPDLRRAHEVRGTAGRHAHAWPLSQARVRLLRLLRAQLTAPSGLAFPMGETEPRGRAATASGASGAGAYCLQSRRFHCI